MGVRGFYGVREIQSEEDLSRTHSDLAPVVDVCRQLSTTTSSPVGLNLRIPPILLSIVFELIRGSYVIPVDMRCESPSSQSAFRLVDAARRFNVKADRGQIDDNNRINKRKDLTERVRICATKIRVF